VQVYKTRQELFEWCRIAVEELPTHPQAKVKLKIVASPKLVHQEIADAMIDEVKKNNLNGAATRWILPCGPKGQYPIFVERVNKERIDLKNVHVFHMDDHLDWQGRPLPLDHPCSYEGWMNRHFYGPIDRELQIPLEQRHFPRVFALDEMAEQMRVVGGIDSVYGGIGYRGHIAYNEPPRSPWYRIGKEEFGNSTTRILHLNDDTLIALSQRGAGGCSDAIPPMAVTLGMRELLAARRIRLYSDTGAWKQTVIRMVLFGEVSPEIPATYVQEHPDCLITVDSLTAACPLAEE
jgi:glucosamine-6-phosphate deaminase